MSETRRKYDAEFREGAVRIIRETGKPIAQVARDLVREGAEDRTLHVPPSDECERRDQRAGEHCTERADYWSDEPAILSGGYGFDNIIGLPDLDQATVRDAGGSWYGGIRCTSGATPTEAMHTSSASVDVIPLWYEGFADYDDGLPVVFSWPVASETVNPSDFQFTLNTGEAVFGHAAGMNPNWENNERNTVVIFGDFGNRKKSAEPSAVFPVRLDIVADDTPLTLVGPDGREVSAVGFSWTTDTSP